MPTADIRVVVVTDAGDKAFASGADISEFSAQRTAPADRAAYDRGQAATAEAWASLDKPVIAMISGILPGRRAAHRAAGGHQDCLRRQPVRRSGGPARAGLRL